MKTKDRLNLCHVAKAVFNQQVFYHPPSTTLAKGDDDVGTCILCAEYGKV